MKFTVDAICHSACQQTGGEGVEIDGRGLARELVK